MRVSRTFPYGLSVSELELSSLQTTAAVGCGVGAGSCDPDLRLALRTTSSVMATDPATNRRMAAIRKTLSTPAALPNSAVRI